MVVHLSPVARLAAAQALVIEHSAALLDANDDCEAIAFAKWLAEARATVAELEAPVTLSSKVWLVGGHAVVSGLGMSRILLVATVRNNGLVDLRVTSEGETFTATGLTPDASVQSGIEQAIAA